MRKHCGSLLLNVPKVAFGSAKPGNGHFVNVLDDVFLEPFGVPKAASRREPPLVVDAVVAVVLDLVVRVARGAVVRPQEHARALVPRGGA